MIKNKNKFIIPSVLTLVIGSSIALCSYGFAQVIIEKNITTKTDNKLMGWTREDEEISKTRYAHDALLQDAIEKSKTDSVLFYKINGASVITRFSFVAHIMKILELNPEKRIEIYAINLLNLDMDYFKKFPNVVYNEFNETVLSNNATYSYNLEFLQNVYDKFGGNVKVDGYFDDYTYMAKVSLYIRGFNSPLDRLKIYNEFILLGQLESMNFFSDGTKSVEYFSQLFKQAYLLSNNLYNTEDKNYTNARLMRQAVKNGQISKEVFLEKNNALLFLTSLMTIDFKDPNRTKYFLPTTDFIPEMNRPDNNTNYKYGENDIFSPYNSVNMDIITFMKDFDQIVLRKILKIKEDFDPDSYIQQMNNNKNYIYSGGKMNTQERIDSNIKTLVAIKNYANSKHPTESDKIIVWFKGHPADENILETLQKRIGVLYPGDNGSWIQVLDNKVPFEFYSIYDVFASDPTNNKEVFLFSTYSTLVMILHASGQGSDITKIIVDNTTIYSEDKIIGIYGYDSKIFPGKNLSTLEDFENSFS